MGNLIEDKLEVLASDKAMLDAIRKVFTEKISEAKPDIDKGDSNIRIGEKYRAYYQAKKILVEVLLDIGARLNEKVDPVIINKGK